jgi:uncharacterized lipoprotein YbaY
MILVRFDDGVSRVATLLACAMLSLAATPVRATGDDSGVGVVAEYRPAASRFTLARPPKGESVPVRIGTVVMAGDRVTLPAGASVMVQLADGKVSQFKGPGSFTVPDARPLGKLAVIFTSLFFEVFDDEYRLEGTAASRGGEKCATEGETVKAIEVPILVPGARVVAGERDLPLAWRGGCAPFIVTLLTGGQALVDRESIEGRQVRLDDVALPPGRYSVVITDAAGRKFETTLEATGEGPPLPVELAADTTSLGVIAQAVWLAEHDGGRWRLESFERLRPLIRAGDPLAGTIGDGVLWGSAAP